MQQKNHFKGVKMPEWQILTPGSGCRNNMPQSLILFPAGEHPPVLQVS